LTHAFLAAFAAFNPSLPGVQDAARQMALAALGICLGLFGGIPLLWNYVTNKHEKAGHKLLQLGLVGGAVALLITNGGGLAQGLGSFFNTALGIG
jgi:hypothetical protein